MKERIFVIICLLFIGFGVYCAGENDRKDRILQAERCKNNVWVEGTIEYDLHCRSWIDVLFTK